MEEYGTHWQFVLFTWGGVSAPSLSHLMGNVPYSQSAEREEEKYLPVTEVTVPVSSLTGRPQWDSSKTSLGLKHLNYSFYCAAEASMGAIFGSGNTDSLVGKWWIICQGHHRPNKRVPFLGSEGNRALCLYGWLFFWGAAHFRLLNHVLKLKGDQQHVAGRRVRSAGHSTPMQTVGS